MLVAIVEDTLAILAARVAESATAKSLTEVILVLAVPILVASAADAATRALLVEV